MQTITVIYEKRKGDTLTKLNKKKRVLTIISFLRLTVFLGWVISEYFALTTSNLTLVILLFSIFILLFTLLIITNEKLIKETKYLMELVKICQNELNLLNGDYKNFDSGLEFINPNHSYTYDLDIFGNSSIFQYLNRTCTIIGKSTLANYLSSPLKEKKELILRQKAIAELKNKIEWRQNFQAIGNLYSEKKSDKENILNWLNEPLILFNSKLYRILLFIWPFLVIIQLILSILQIVPYKLLLITFFFQIIIVGYNKNKIRKLQKLGNKVKTLKKYGKLLNEIENENFISQKLKNLTGILKTDNKTTSYHITKLAKISKAYDNTLNIIAGPILNFFFLWSLQCIIRMDKWKIKFKNELPKWFYIISEFDALSSLGCFAFNNPDYIFPEIENNKFILETKELGHPLINKSVRVNNNFNLKNLSNFVMITGANMAGKSTFLRTVGVNLVLAMSGAPVCAKKFRFFPTDIFTSMRTTDSLEKHESYFYAELKRLKTIIDKLNKNQINFIILDELLKGTNSKDKETGSRIFIEKLIKLKGVGLIATHDLNLVDIEKKYPDKVKNQCFEVEIKGEKIFFDYKLKDGVTQKMNASLLMRQMSIIDN